MDAKSLNPIEEYESVDKFLRDFYKYTNGIARRLLFSTLLRMILLYPFGLDRRIKLHAIIRSARPSISKYKKEISLLNEFAKDSEKSSPFFDIMISEQPVHEISRALKKHFPDADFENLKDIHEWNSKRILRRQVNLKEIFGFLFGLGTLFLSTIPKSVVEQFINYEKFQIGIFWMILILVVYLGLILIPAWMGQLSRRRIINFVGDVLSYPPLMKSD